jgi:NADPH:quinone reductase-like Zn-dependent oxidoreductase
VDNAVVQGYLKDMLPHRFPLIPGVDGSGLIDVVGDGVEGWSAGDEVFGAVGKMSFGEGTFGESATMSSGSVARKPSSLDHATAAAVPTAGVTALTMAGALDLREGQLLLAIGATGGVGSYLVQLAARGGARVVAVCRGRNADYARSMGAADVIDYQSEDVEDALRSRYSEGIDAIADMVGDREGLARLTERLRPGGRVASAVGAADEASLSARGFTAVNVQTEVTTDSLSELGRMLEAGTLRRPELRTFVLEEAGDALATVATGHTRGKLVIDVASARHALPRHQG